MGLTTISQWEFHISCVILGLLWLSQGERIIGDCQEFWGQVLIHFYN
jgi:hypothetical protein